MSRYLGGAQSIIGVLVLLTPYVLFPVCSKQMETKMGTFVPMSCHWSAQATLGMGALALLAGLALLVSRRAEAKRLLSVLIAGLGVAVISVPTWLIGMCANAAMDCRIGTLPALVTLGGISVVIAAIAFFTAQEAPEQAHEPLRAPLLS